MPKGKMQVTVANSECVVCLGVYCTTAFTIGDEEFATDYYVLPLAGYDVTLGTHWLASQGPFLLDFGTLTMSF
jgi:hypothetical protein